MPNPVDRIGSFIAHLQALGAVRLRVPKETVLFRQGDVAADNILFIVSGEVALTVVSEQGKVATLTHLGPGDLVGEGGLIAQAVHSHTATTVSPCDLLQFDSFHIHVGADRRLSEYMMSFLIRRVANIETDMIDLIFNSSEKRLARTLLALAKYRTGDSPQIISHVTHEMLAQRVGTTRPRITFLMNKFRRLGLIDYNGVITVHPALVNVVLEGAEAPNSRSSRQR